MSAKKVTVDFIFSGVAGAALPAGETAWAEVLSNGSSLVKADIEPGTQAMCELDGDAVLLVKVCTRRKVMGISRETLQGTAQIVTTLLEENFQDMQLVLTGGVLRGAKLHLRARTRIWELKAEQANPLEENQEQANTLEANTVRPDPAQAFASAADARPTAPGLDSEEDDEMIPDQMTRGAAEQQSSRAAGPWPSPETIASKDMDDKVKDYILNIIFASRFPDKFGLTELKPFIGSGGSPRATLSLTKASRANAFIRHRGFVTPEDVKSVAYDILRHRILLTYEAEAENITSETIVRKILDRIEVP